MLLFYIWKQGITKMKDAHQHMKWNKKNRIYLFLKIFFLYVWEVHNFEIWESVRWIFQKKIKNRYFYYFYLMKHTDGNLFFLNEKQSRKEKFELVNMSDITNSARIFYSFVIFNNILFDLAHSSIKYIIFSANIINKKIAIRIF